jgi:hypothetical protein
MACKFLSGSSALSTKEGPRRIVGRLAGSIVVLGLVAASAHSSQAVTGCAVAGIPTAPPLRFHNNPPPWPTLLSPLDGAATANRTPTFQWTLVGDSEGDSVIFQLQVDNSPDFSSPEIDTRGHAYASFTPDRPLPRGTYCWRVRSIDDIEARSPYSAAFEVTITANQATMRER